MLFLPSEGAGSGSLPVSSVTAYVGLGSNMGDAEAHLAAGRAALASFPGVSILALSPVYRTEPQGKRDQPFFANQVLSLSCDTGATPLGLLERLLETETALGRVRVPGEQFGPRVLDLDLLLFGNERMVTGRLTLPHPRMLERAFVLVPLSDIAPELVLPQGIRLAEALKRVAFSIQDDIIYQATPPKETSACGNGYS